MYAFQSNYFLRILRGDYHPFTPNEVYIDDNNIELKRRNWHLISTDSEHLHFQNITGITIDKHLFGATIIIKSTGVDDMVLDGFWKSSAQQIKDICRQKIADNTQKGTAKIIAEAFNHESKPTSNNSFSVADELIKLKGLLNDGVISPAEFDREKSKLLNR